MNKNLKLIERSIMSILAEKAGPDAINFGIGEPIYETPEELINEYRKIIKEEISGYGPVAGWTSLREHLASVKKYVFNTTKDNIVITCGATEALNDVLCALLNSGDEVIYPDPGFVIYKPMIELRNAVPIALKFRKEDDFDLNLDNLVSLISNKTKAIIVNTPNNPTGAIYTKENIEILSTLAEKYNFYIISDEVYDKLVFEKEHISPAEYTDKCIVINSVSKLFRFAGHRVGWAISSKDLSDQILKVHQYTTFSAPIYGQKIALYGLQATYLLNQMKQYYKNNRDIMLKGLDDISGINYSIPQGTFFVWCDVSDYSSSWDVSVNLMKHGLIVTPNSGPGKGFGTAYPNYIRISFAQKPEKIYEGLNIMKSILNMQKKKN